MANVLVNEQSLVAIGDAIREKLDSTDTYKPAEMAEAVRSIEGGSGEGYSVSSINNGDGTQTLQIEDGYFPTDELEITANGQYDLKGYGTALVNVEGGGDMPDEYPIGGSLMNKTLTGYKFPENTTATTLPIVFTDCLNITEMTLPNSITALPGGCFLRCTNLRRIGLPTALTRLEANALGTTNIENLSEELMKTRVTFIGQYALSLNPSLTNIEFPQTVERLEAGALADCRNLKTVRFKSKPISINILSFNNSLALTDIYVPWAEGEVAGAPWSAIKATIHYNYMEE